MSFAHGFTDHVEPIRPSQARLMLTLVVVIAIVVVPAAGVLPAPDLELRVTSLGHVAIGDVDLLDHALVTGEIEHAFPIALLEILLDLRMPLLAVRERDLEVE